LQAKNMLGAGLPYDEIAYLYCRVFDFGFEVLGAPDGNEVVVERGSLRERFFAAIYLRNDISKALFTIGRPTAETKAIEALIRYRVNLRAVRSRLPNPAFGLEEVPSGGILSNSPLELVLERCGVAGKHVIIVDLFASTRPLPTNMMEILARRDEIVYAERVHKDVHTRELIHDFQILVEDMR
jgi:hypothetical protein